MAAIDDDDYGWEAPAGTPTHADTKIPEDMDFFISPPPEIGELVSAYSTLTRKAEPMGATKRMIIAVVIAFALWGGLWLIISIADPRDGNLLGHLLGGILGLVGFIITYYVTSFKHTCSYVGKNGLSRYTLKGSRFADPVEELLEFEHATDLFTGQTRHYTNGVYTGTHYFYRWDGVDGRKVFQLSGTFQSQEGSPAVKDPFHFAQNAEIAWSLRLLDQMQEELEQHGSVEFKVNKNDAVRVGPGFMEFCFGNKEQRLDGEELKHISIGGGTFSFKTADAKWYSSKGKFSFNYANMANARCFLLVLNHLLGVTFE